jgi:nitroimidazol reductase NimA-like FMN-containing flavoprotein (pyridoxamine 5'-phosphate oxidase superfamily)
MAESVNGVIPATHVDILEKKGFAHVATIGPDGAPQSSPVWYGWDGEHLLFSQPFRSPIRTIPTATSKSAGT